jgi:Fe-S cluster assembly protein SufD
MRDGKETMIATIHEGLGNYVAAFDDFQKTAEGRDVPWLGKLREEAFAQFKEVGFPGSSDEDWRFTNITPISGTDFQLPPKGNRRVSRREIEPCFLEGASCTLVFVNGRFAPELSAAPDASEGIIARSLAEQIRTDPGTVEANLGRFLGTKRNAFCALNTAFLEDGAYVHIRQGLILERPIHLLFVSVGSDAPRMIHPRNLIVAETGSEATIVEEYVSFGEGRLLCNAATEVRVDAAANVSHYRIERKSAQIFHVSTLRLEQSRDTQVMSHSILLGGTLVRNNVHPVLAGMGGECLVNGLFLGTGREHLDNYMLVEHRSPHCDSRQFYNGILDEQAKGVFHGRIIVHQHAQKTDAKQTNRNILLSDDAQIDTKPQLEIFADDVKCTHGATIGQIDEDALFYLRTRGIDERSARRLLLESFAKECLDRMNQGPARSHVETLILGRVFEMGEKGDLTAGRQSGGREPGPERRWQEVQ